LHSSPGAHSRDPLAHPGYCSWPSPGRGARIFCASRRLPVSSARANWQLHERRRKAQSAVELATNGGLRCANLPHVYRIGRIAMNGNRYYGVRVEGAKYGVGFGSALAIAISYTNNHSILWAIIHGILGWLYVIYIALFG
jgi:hypothetical protein